jgi:hypothetical protein
MAQVVLEQPPNSTLVLLLQLFDLSSVVITPVLGSTRRTLPWLPSPMWSAPPGPMDSRSGMPSVAAEASPLSP